MINLFKDSEQFPKNETVNTAAPLQKIEGTKSFFKRAMNTVSNFAKDQVDRSEIVGFTKKLFEKKKPEPQSSRRDHQEPMEDFYAPQLYDEQIPAPYSKTEQEGVVDMQEFAHHKNQQKMLQESKERYARTQAEKFEKQVQNFEQQIEAAELPTDVPALFADFVGEDLENILDGATPEIYVASLIDDDKYVIYEPADNIQNIADFQKKSDMKSGETSAIADFAAYKKRRDGDKIVQFPMHKISEPTPAQPTKWDVLSAMISATNLAPEAIVALEAMVKRHLPDDLVVSPLPQQLPNMPA